MAVNAAANRALAPEASKLLQLETQAIHIDLGCQTTPQNSPQSMRVWPGRKPADTTQRHLGHALGGKAGNEAVAQVAHAADVDVAHRVVVSTREDGEEVEVLRTFMGL